MVIDTFTGVHCPVNNGSDVTPESELWTNVQLYGSASDSQHRQVPDRATVAFHKPQTSLPRTGMDKVCGIYNINLSSAASAGYLDPPIDRIITVVAISFAASD